MPLGELEATLEERVTELEIQLTHQQRQVEELNEFVFRQQQVIDQMAGELRQIKEQLQMLLRSLVKEPEEEEPPPHY